MMAMMLDNWGDGDDDRYTYDIFDEENEAIVDCWFFGMGTGSSDGNGSMIWRIVDCCDCSIDGPKLVDSEVDDYFDE